MPPAHSAYSYRDVTAQSPDSFHTRGVRRLAANPPGRSTADGADSRRETVTGSGVALATDRHLPLAPPLSHASINNQVG